jgi:mannosyltransferase
MNLVIDNIIFSLQNSGGISVLWSELLSRYLLENDLNINFIENKNNNIFRKNLNIQNHMLLESSLIKFPLWFDRYLNISNLNKSGIFHSTYYRTTNNPNYLNVTTVHDFIYELYPNNFKKILHINQKIRAINNSKSLICVSESTKLDLLKIYPHINPKIVKVIYNGVNEIYRQLNDTDNYKYFLSFKSKKYVLYIGDRKSKHKNFIITVKSCKIVNLPLVIVGDKLSKNEFSFLNFELGINNYQTFNNISNEDLNIIYNHAFCLLYPSIYEGFGIPILEAQRAGCLVISSNRSSIPEVSGDGALLLDIMNEFTLSEAITSLQIDNNKAVMLINKGFINSNKFSWNKCFNETFNLYKELWKLNFN